MYKDEDLINAYMIREISIKLKDITENRKI